MFDVKVTINGKPATEANIKGELEKAIVTAMIEGVKEKVRSALTPAEAQQISINFNGSTLNTLSRAEISGPDDIVKKVRAALSD